MKEQPHLRFFLIIILSWSLLISGCNSLNPYHSTDLSSAVDEISNSTTVTTKNLPIVKLTELARLLQRKYTAAIVGDVNEQRVIQYALLALLTATSAAVLFGGDSDLLKGLILGTGAVYAYGKTGSNSERRKIYKAAADAFGCIARRAGALAPANSEFAHYLAQQTKFTQLYYKARNATLDMEMVKEKLITDNTTNKDCKNAINKYEETFANKRDTYLGEIKNILKVAAIIHWEEEEILHNIISLQTTIIYELSRLEPDFTAFANSISNDLNTGQYLSGINIDNKNIIAKQPPNNAKEDNSELIEKIESNCNTKANTYIAKNKNLSNIINELSAELANSNIDMDIVREEIKLAQEATRSMPSECWQYSKTTITLDTDNIVLTETNKSKTIIVKGLNGSPQYVITKNKNFVDVLITPLTGNMAALNVTCTTEAVFVKPNNTVDGVIYDTSGNSKVFKLTLSKD